jgi:Uma2 family endonuclease
MPDDGYHRYELDRGRLLTMAPAGTLHSAVAVRLGAALLNFVDAAKAGVVLGADAGFKLESDPDTVRAPDVAFIARDRIPADGLSLKFFAGPPDLAVEVLSPTDKRSEVDRKIAQYLRVGVKEVWFVEPVLRRVTVHKPGTPPAVLHEGESLDGGDLLPGFQYALSRLFDFEL